MQPCKRQVGLPTGSPPACGAVPAGASLKRQIPGGSGDRVTRFLRQRTKENRQLRVGTDSEPLVGLRSKTSLYTYERQAEVLRAVWKLRGHGITSEIAFYCEPLLSKITFDWTG